MYSKFKKKLDTYEVRCKQALTKKLEFMRLRYEKLMKSRAFTDPTKKINEYYMKIDMQIKQMQNIIKNKLQESKNNATNVIMKLDALSPLKTLSRGYSITENNKEIIKSIKQVKVNDEISVKLQDGKITAMVKEVKT